MRISDWSSDVCSSDLPPGGDDDSVTGLLEIRGRRGISMAHGYLDDETENEQAWDPDGWFKTGDRMRLHADGWLEFVSRDKDMLKVGGENVAAAEIERVIATVTGVKEVAVVGAPDAMRRSEEHTSELQSLMRISYA